MSFSAFVHPHRESRRLRQQRQTHCLASRSKLLSPSFTCLPLIVLVRRFSRLVPSRPAASRAPAAGKRLRFSAGPARSFQNGRQGCRQRNYKMNCPMAGSRLPWQPWLKQANVSVRITIVTAMLRPETVSGDAMRGSRAARWFRCFSSATWALLAGFGEISFILVAALMRSERRLEKLIYITSSTSDLFYLLFLQSGKANPGLTKLSILNLEVGLQRIELSFKAIRTIMEEHLRKFSLKDTEPGQRTLDT